MKKDKAWLIQKVSDIFWRVEIDGNFNIQNANVMFDDISNLIDELDEPETLNEEWINEHSKYYTMENAVEISDLKNLLLPQPKKPVIPQFVAEFIETYKKRDGSLGELLGHIEWSKKGDGEVLLKVVDWVYPDNYSGVDTDGINIIARAWLDGYEVEEEQKYRVIDRHKVCLLAKEEERNKVETVAKLVEIYGHDHVELNYHLTEQEIKDYDERYWAFAQEVTQ